MQFSLISVLGIVAGGLVWRILASIGFGLATANYINKIIDGYLVRSITQMNTALHPDVSAYLNIARVDDCISIMLGSLVFVSTYKSLKLIFVRKL
ncbi:DUF2523 family protein [Moraxella oblonga]|uniref:DUF2523 family protein n=1 Tax=Moraxella oblonga TaxID=200413 RepID=UPI00082F63BC|nr:DUF2523 family protein [Moraxella oblonga]